MARDSVRNMIKNGPICFVISSAQTSSAFARVAQLWENSNFGCGLRKDVAPLRLSHLTLHFTADVYVSTARHTAHFISPNLADYFPPRLAGAVSSDLAIVPRTIFFHRPPPAVRRPPPSFVGKRCMYPFVLLYYCDLFQVLMVAAEDSGVM